MELAKVFLFIIKFLFQARPTCFRIGGLLILFFFMLSGSGSAWHTEPHRAITRNALTVLPEPLQQVINPHLDILLYGSVEPDYNRVEDHKLYLHVIRGTAPGPGGAHFALDQFAQQAEAMIKTGEPMDKIALVLGQAAHFIQDLNVPLHTIWGETKEQHAAYEGAAYYWNWPGDKYGYDGFYLVKKYKCFALETAKRSQRYVDQALKNPAPPAIIEKTWNDAVNDTANLWQSIFYRAVGPERALEVYGIPAPKGEKGKGWFCG